MPAAAAAAAAAETETEAAAAKAAETEVARRAGFLPTCDVCDGALLGRVYPDQVHHRGDRGVEQEPTVVADIHVCSERGMARGLGGAGSS